MIFGAGLGFPPDLEFGSFGEPTDDRERAELLDEGLAILDGFWSGEPVAVEGRHHRLDGVRFLPRPVQRPRIPIWIAGMWPNRAPFRRAARWDGVFPIAVADGGPIPIGPDAFAEAVAFTRSLRTSDAPLDAVVQGAPDTEPGDYAGRGRDVVAPRRRRRGGVGGTGPRRDPPRAAPLIRRVAQACRR